MTMEKQMKSKYKRLETRMTKVAVSDEKGSVIVIVLLVLLLLTLGGISATNMSVTESFIVRNSGIHKQNLQLAEMAALEGFREILSRYTAEELLPGESLTPDWIRDRNIWNNDPSVNDIQDDNSFPLNDNNSAVPFSNPGIDINTMVQRGDADDPMLRYYFIGWREAPQSSLVMTTAMWRQGRVIGVYDSERYGRASVEIGVLKRF